MQAAGNCGHLDSAAQLYGAMDWAVLAQRVVRPGLVAMRSIGFQNLAQVRRSQGHNMIEAFTPDRADQPYAVVGLPG